MSTALEGNSEDYTNIEIDNNENNNSNDMSELNNDNDTDKSNEKKIESNVDILFEKLQKQFIDSNLILKTLHNNLKILHKEVIKERKELLKNSNKNKKKKKKNKLSGFAVPTKITKKLADFLQVEEDSKISRTYVTKFICKYIKDNNLQNPENKKIIIPDEKFKILFDGQLDGLNNLEYFNIQTYLKEHFIK